MSALRWPLRPALAGLLAFSLASCAAVTSSERIPAEPSSPAPLPMFADLHSFARPEEARVIHVGLDLLADFESRVLSGTASLDFWRAPGARELVLDTRNLTIQRVVSGQQELRWRLGREDSILGRALIVELPERGSRLDIHYHTSPEAAALQWLSPEQTAGKRHPYLFSQGQAILTRTWIPTQDSPGIRQTYSASIRVPEGMRAVMSAEMLTPEGERAPRGLEYRFHMREAIPPYLIALAVGELAFRELGPRTGVYTEPVMLERAVHEFQDLEAMVETAEDLYGPYHWGRYDVLVLPPSFPFGGMENPRLTFVTPTILAGDRSLVSLIAHELAHSWSGNLVTHATWNDFWLNEGFTVYFENRIMEALYGEERAEMLRVLGWRSLQEEMEALGGVTAPDTRLQLDLTGRDPDAAMTEVAYEKGAAFLRHIEQAVGRERFDHYLRGYFERSAFQPMTAERFLADLRRHLLGGDPGLEEKIQAHSWVYEPGIPEGAQVPQSPRLGDVQSQVRRFGEGTPAVRLQTSEWTTQEWQHFLTSLPKELSVTRLEDLDRTFRLSERENSEILFAWLLVALRNRYEPALPALERFLTTQGRRKFLKPLYESLMKEGEWGQGLARRIYPQARRGYHSVSTHTLDAIVR